MKKKNNNISVSGGLRTEDEKLEASLNKKCFDANPNTWEIKMENFPKYIKRQNLTRFLALYEIFKLVINVKGSIVECGVNHGFGTMAWSKFSAIIEPVNLTRKIYGFDTFEGFPSLSKNDESSYTKKVKVGDLASSSMEEILKLSAIHDKTRFLGHIPKIELIKGDAIKTIPKFVADNPHILVSLLFLDFDLYKPTKVALEEFLPKMTKGAVIAFDELDNPLWPGETKAMIEFFKENKLKIQRFPFDPYIGYAVLD
ncbi:class I SAM-dependent methyltransferase [Pelagibacteraceae bacterium]|nr:class I SAM-dependent methyltransferase [Pelagibacteraceae bacterium]